MVETTDATDLQHLAGLFSAYDCRIEPVIDLSFVDAVRTAAPAAPDISHHVRLPDMPPAEPHEGAFSDDDIYDTED